MKRKFEVGLRVYTKAGDVASGSWSSCVDYTDPVSGFAVGPADAPVIQDEVDPVVLDAVAPMCDGDPDDVAPKTPCEQMLWTPQLR